MSDERTPIADATFALLEARAISAEMKAAAWEKMARATLDSLATIKPVVKQLEDDVARLNKFMADQTADVTLDSALSTRQRTE